VYTTSNRDQTNWNTENKNDYEIEPKKEQNVDLDTEKQKDGKQLNQIEFNVQIQ